MSRNDLRCKVISLRLEDRYQFIDGNTDILDHILSFLDLCEMCHVSRVSQIYRKRAWSKGFTPWKCLCSRCCYDICHKQYNFQNDLDLTPYFPVIIEFTEYIKNLMTELENPNTSATKISITYTIFLTSLKNYQYFTPNYKEACLKKLVQFNYGDINLIGKFNSYRDVIKEFYNLFYQRIEAIHTE